MKYRQAMWECFWMVFHGQYKAAVRAHLAPRNEARRLKALKRRACVKARSVLSSEQVGSSL